MDRFDDFPTEFQLSAAHRVSQLLLEVPSARTELRNAYVTVPTGGLFGVEDLLNGEQLLIDSGLVEVRGDLLAACDGLANLAELDEAEASSALLIRVLRQRRPPWLSASLRNGEVVADLIPESATRTLRGLDLSPDEREALLLAAGRRADTSADSELGAAGEERVAFLARQGLTNRGYPDLAKRVQRVSLISDQLGYDISAPKLNGNIGHWEVKTTRAQFRCHVVISRNEFETACRDPSWALVICRQIDTTIELLGWCSVDALRPYMPVDSQSAARWLSVELTLSDQELVAGLPL